MSPTDRDLVQERLKAEGEVFARLAEFYPIGICIVDDTGRITFANKHAEKILGLTRSEITQRVYDDPEWKITDLHGEPFPSGELPFARIMATGQSVFDIRHAIEWPDGRRIMLAINGSPLKNEAGNLTGAIFSIEDVTVRVRHQEAFRRVPRALKAISGINRALVKAKSEEELLNSICREIVVSAGYRLAWVGYALDDEAKTVQPKAWAGHELGYLDEIAISWAEDREAGRGPTGRAIRTGRTQVARDISTEPGFKPWRDPATQRGYRSSVALPLVENGRVFGALNIHSAESDAFDQEELKLLEEAAADLSYGVSSLRAKEDRRAAREALRQSEKKYRTIFDQSGDPIYITSPQGRLLDINQAAASIFGY
ncbi:MAG: GAF domain-containing protein, partial [Deltaproteobacteria bacterium]|nr:GAF domain-containing protein [Deltaproteobacteria bacterium]